MISYLLTAFVWTSHPSLPLGFVASNVGFETITECTEVASRNELQYKASVGNFLIRTAKLRVNKIFAIKCMTVRQIMDLNLLLGHPKESVVQGWARE